MVGLRMALVHWRAFGLCLPRCGYSTVGANYNPHLNSRTNSASRQESGPTRRSLRDVLHTGTIHSGNNDGPHGRFGQHRSTFTVFSGGRWITLVTWEAVIWPIAASRRKFFCRLH